MKIADYRSHTNHLNSILQLNIIDIDVTHSSVKMPMTSKCLDNTDIDLILSKCSDELPAATMRRRAFDACLVI